MLSGKSFHFAHHSNHHFSTKTSSNSPNPSRSWAWGALAGLFSILILLSAGGNAADDTLDFNQLLIDEPTAAGSPDRPLLDPYSLPLIAINPGEVAHWKNTYYANALAPGYWLEFEGGQWGKPIPVRGNRQLDQRGYPQWLNAGKKLRAVLAGHDAQHSDLSRGHVVLTWKGRADIRLSGATAYLPSESDGAATGSRLDGRRVYHFAGDAALSDLVVHTIDESRPITDIKVWLADPADPENASLEGELWHPTFLERLRDENWGVIRATTMSQHRRQPTDPLVGPTPARPCLRQRHPQHPQSRARCRGYEQAKPLPAIG